MHVSTVSMTACNRVLIIPLHSLGETLGMADSMSTSKLSYCAASAMQVLARMLRDFAYGRSHKERLAFLHVATAAAATFSSTFFAAHYVHPCLMCAFDPVPNVRMAVTPLLPVVKRAVRLPEGLEQLERLNSAMSSLLTDVDRDVSGAARRAHGAFKAQAVRLTGMGVVSSGAASVGCVMHLKLFCLKSRWGPGICCAAWHVNSAGQWLELKL